MASSTPVTYIGRADLRGLTLLDKDVFFKPGEPVKLTDDQLADLRSQGVAEEFDIPTEVESAPEAPAADKPGKAGSK